MSYAFSDFLVNEQFTTLAFPIYESVVYILSCRTATGKSYWPFYVGESGRGTRRLGDYQTSTFAATTDFKVGTTVKHLAHLQHEVFVHYIASQDRRKDEAAWIAKLESKGYKLLNRVPNYNYKTAVQSEVVSRIAQFVKELDVVIRTHGDG